MKMNTLKIKLFFASVFLLALSACNEDKLDLYDQEATGSSIYFYTPYATANQSVPTTQHKFCFAFEQLEVKEKTIDIPVRITGIPQSTDREFSIKFDPNSTLKEGIHFVLENDKLFVPADSIKSSVSIKLIRTADLQTEPLELRMKLVKSADFNTYFREQFNIAKTKATSVLDFSLVVDDIFGAPDAWIQYSSRFEPALGKYSKEKFNLLLEIFDLDVELFTDPTVNPNTAFGISTMTYWKNYFKYWLLKEKEAGRIHVDGNGDPITIPN